MSFDSMLNKTCTIQRKTRSQTNTGSVQDVWENFATDVPVRRSANTSRRSNTQAQVTDSEYTFFMKPDVGITLADRIVFENETFEVVFVREMSNDHHLEVLANTKSFK